MFRRIFMFAFILVILLLVIPIETRVASDEMAIIKVVPGPSDVIDVYTETERAGYFTSNIGKGPSQPADPYKLGEDVTLFALVTHNGYPLQSRLVSWEVYDPQGKIVSVTANMTNAAGVANLNFIVPGSEDALGVWFVFGKTYVAENSINDTLRFEVYDPPVVEGDINGDGFVDVKDLIILTDNWYKRVGEPDFDERADLNDNGIVDVGDLIILTNNWGYN